MLFYFDNLLSFVALQEKIMRLVGSNQDFMESDSPNRSHMSLLTPKNLEDRFGHLLKMASLLAVQRLISTHIFFVDPFSMAYGRSKYDKKTGYCSPGTPGYMAFATKGQRKAVAAFEGNLGI